MHRYAVSRIDCPVEGRGCVLHLVIRNAVHERSRSGLQVGCKVMQADKLMRNMPGSHLFFLIRKIGFLENGLEVVKAAELSEGPPLHTQG